MARRLNPLLKKEPVNIVAVSGTMKAVALRLLGTHLVGDPVKKDEVKKGVYMVDVLVEAASEEEAETRHIQQALFLGNMVLSIVLGSRCKSSNMESKATENHTG